MPLKLRQEFLHADWKARFPDFKTDIFETLWQLKLDNIDEGNFERRGWSQVARWEVNGRVFYIKRQSNHLCLKLTGIHLKVPTCKAEFDNINWYQRAKVPSLDPVYFGWRRSAEGAEEAILVTESLEDYEPLDELMINAQSKSHLRRRQIYKAVGQSIARLHRAGIEHRNLYPKHIFISKHETHEVPAVRFIDLETSRPVYGLRRRMLRDIETLGRRAIWLSKTDKLRLLLAYAGKERVDESLRKDIVTILLRTLDKRERP